MTVNAAAVTMMAHAIGFMLRPGKALGWFAGWLNDMGDQLVGIPFLSGAYDFVTHSLRECVTCLTGQLCVLSYWLTQGWPDNLSGYIALCYYAGAGITISETYLKLTKNGR